MLLRLYLVERHLKKLLEVPLGLDADFTVRQFLYHVLRNELKFTDYLHYGLFV
jgi:hypothetical protein